MKGRQIHYEPEELAWIERHKELPRDQMHRRFCFIWQRDDVSKAALNGLCKRKGWGTGRTGCFVAGLVPHNKGKAMPFNPRSAATRFKKGNLPHNVQYLGHERIAKGGYIEVSVAEPNPYTGYERTYVLKHLHEWEKVNGPVPAGMCLKCLSTDRTDTRPENWEMIPRALLPRLNGRHGRNYEAAEPEIRPTILAIAKLEHRARTVRQEATA